MQPERFAMSELRQRKGGSSLSGTQVPDAPMVGQEAHAENPQLESFLQEYLNPQQKPGISNEVKKAREALMKDPYDPKLLWDVGEAYANDKQWKECANVLARGLPRSKEIPEEIADDYYMTLSHASLMNSQFEQAFAAFERVARPTGEGLTRYQILACQVLCSKGDLTGGLKAFKAAINETADEERVQVALATWLYCYPYLKKVGAKEVAENAVLELVDTDEARERWEACKRLVELKEAMDAQPNSNMQSLRLLLGAAAALCAVAAAGYLMLLR